MSLAAVPASDREVTRLDNEPPTSERIQIDELERLYAEDLEIYRKRLAEVDDMPAVVNDDAAQGQITDYIKRLTSCIKMLDGARKTEKEPFMEKARIVQNFFAGKTENLEKIKSRVSEIGAKYAKAKEDAERRAREEKAKQEREDAARKLAEAQESERLAREAEERARKAREDADRIAAEEKAKAEAAAIAAKKAAEDEAARIKKIADDEAAAAQAEILRLKQQQELAAQQLLQSQAETDRLKQETADAEKRARDAELAKKQSEKDAREKLAEADRVAKLAAQESREKIKVAEDAAKEAKSEARDAVRTSNADLDAATRQDRSAGKAERKADASGTELSRTRSDASLSSVSETWTAEILSRDLLLQDAAKIWEHIPFDALDQAVKAYARANKSEGVGKLQGATVFADTQFRVA